MALVENVDYMLTSEPVILKAGPHEYVSTKVLQIYLSETNDIAYKCIDCDYVRPNPKSVESHYRQRHQDTKHRVSQEVMNRAKAFLLLPEPMQANLLRKLAESIEEEADSEEEMGNDGESLPEKVESATLRNIAEDDGRYAKDPETANPLRRYLIENHVTFQSVASLTGINYAVFMNMVNGKSATSMENLEKVSNFVNVPIVELFTEEYIRRCR